MSQFDTQMALGAQPMLQHKLGSPITYIALDSDPVIVTALVGEVRHEQIETTGGDFQRVRVRSITVSRDPVAVGGGIADPQMKDDFIIDKEIWTVFELVSMSVTAVTIRLKSIGLIERGRPGHRKGR